MKLNKVDEKVFQTLKAEGKELTLQELTDKTGEPCKKVFKSLKKFFEHEIIETKARKYSLDGKRPQSSQRRRTRTRSLKNFVLWSLERALLPRPAAYKAAALLG